MINIILFLFRKLQSQLGGQKVLEFYNAIPKANFHFCYINMQKNYLINCCEKLFFQDQNSIEMFTNDLVFTIHLKNKPCAADEHNSLEMPSNTVYQQVDEFTNLYPKRKKLLMLVFQILIKNDLINDDLFFNPFPKLHIADFASFIMNRWGTNKAQTLDPSLVRFCKFLKSRNIILPRVAVKNPLALGLLT